MTESNSTRRSKRGSGPKSRVKSIGKGPDKKQFSRLKRLAKRMQKDPVETVEIVDANLIDNSVQDSISDGVPINVVTDDIDDDEDGMFDLDFTKSENKDSDDSHDLDLIDFDNLDLDSPDDDLDDLDLDDFDLDEPDDDLDLEAPNVLSTSSRESSAIRRLKKAAREKSEKPKRSKGGKAKKPGRSKVPEGYVTLPMCRTASQLTRYWTKTFDAFEVKCLRATARKKALDPYRPALNAIIAGEVFTSTPMITMRVVCDLGRQHLCNGILRAVEGDSALRIYLITIIAGQGLTSHAKTDIELGQSLAREQAFLRDVSRNYFAINELALFNSKGHPGGGQMLQRHTHAIVLLREDDPDPQVAIDKHLKNFEPNFTEIPIIDVRPVETDDMNVARVSAYMCKAPDRCKSWRPAKEGKRSFINNNESGDRPSRFLRLAQIRSMISLEDATFAGGLGAEIRSGLIKTARAQCAAEAPPASRLLHPDAIGSFWVDVMHALNRKSWNLPVIRTRK